MTSSVFGVARSCRSPKSWTPPSPVRIVLPAAAVGAYLVLAWCSLGALVAASTGQALTIEPAPNATTPSALVARTPFDARLDAMAVPTANSRVLTITVDGPNASVDVYCDPTSDGMQIERVHVRPDATMEAFHRLCSPLPAT